MHAYSVNTSVNVNIFMHTTSVARTVDMQVLLEFPFPHNFFFCDFWSPVSRDTETLGMVNLTGHVDVYGLDLGLVTLGSANPPPRTTG